MPIYQYLLCPGINSLWKTDMFVLSLTTRPGISNHGQTGKIPRDILMSPQAWRPPSHNNPLQRKTNTTYLVNPSEKRNNTFIFRICSRSNHVHSTLFNLLRPSVYTPKSKFPSCCLGVLLCHHWSVRATDARSPSICSSRRGALRVQLIGGPSRQAQQAVMTLRMTCWCEPETCTSRRKVRYREQVQTI